MRYLLDSHILVWLDDLQHVAAPVRELLAEPSNEIFLSVVSVWELTLKRALGKLHFTGPFTAVAEAYDIALLPVLAKHVAEVEQLPRFHKDPFDHMLVAQARVEGLMLVTHDEVVTRYPVTSLRV